MMQASGRVTMRDIARETGFTVNTVSRALMGMPDISAATTALIRDKAAQMGYVRNHMASSLRSGRTNCIALIVGHLANPYFSIIFDSVEKAADELGYTVMLFSSHEDDAREIIAIRTALSQHVDGIILFPSQKSTECLSLLRAGGIPFVILSREFVGEKADYVLCQEEEGGYLAARHLIEHGRKKLIYVYDNDLIHSINLRREGFNRACAEFGVTDVRAIQNLDEANRDNAAGTAERIAGLYRLGYDGVVAFCDMVARRLIAQLHALNLRVPEDIGMIGYDNTDSVVPTTLPLCSIDGHCEEMGEAAVRLLDRHIKGDTSAEERLLFPVEVVCRHSCG